MSDRVKRASEASALETRVECFYARGDGIYAKGRVIGYYDSPTYIIETDDGQEVTWLCRLTRPDAAIPATQPMPTKDIDHAGLREDPRHAVIVKALRQPMGVEREWTISHIEGRGTLSGIGPTPLWLDSVEGTGDFIVKALRAWEVDGSKR